MNHDARHRLEDLLGREIAAAQSLAQTLAAERAALTGDSPEAVKEKAAEKIGLLGSIEELEGERRTLWGTSGSDGAAFGRTVAERWRALMEIMAGCRKATTSTATSSIFVRTRFVNCSTSCAAARRRPTVPRERL